MNKNCSCDIGVTLVVQVHLFSIPQALIFKLRGVSVEEELGPDESWISPVDVNLVKIKLVFKNYNLSQILYQDIDKLNLEMMVWV